MIRTKLIAGLLQDLTSTWEGGKLCKKILPYSWSGCCWWWWISSRSGWPLELLTELTIDVFQGSRQICPRQVGPLADFSNMPFLANRAPNKFWCGKLGIGRLAPPRLLSTPGQSAGFLRISFNSMHIDLTNHYILLFIIVTSSINGIHCTQVSATSETLSYADPSLRSIKSLTLLILTVKA